jgi:hypothetical protein
VSLQYKDMCVYMHIQIFCLTRAALLTPSLSQLLLLLIGVCTIQDRNNSRRGADRSGVKAKWTTLLIQAQAILAGI